MLSGNIAILGGSGFLGRGIMRRAENESWDCRFTVYSRDELKQHQCRDKFPDARYVLGDIRDTERLENVLYGHDTVIHAAAMKYVPESESNVSECVAVNIGGTQAVLHAAPRAGVSTVVFISTDKAVLPQNLYGMTKAVGERLVGEAAYQWRDRSDVRIVACRYGNVVGSSGSIVPVFQRQFAESGTILLTDPAMTRFWMSVDEAVDLIVYAVGEQDTGHIYIPSPRTMELGDLAAALVPNARQIITGLRPGEKMHETLVTADESVWMAEGNPDEEAMYFTLPTPYFRHGKPTGQAFTYSSDKAFRMIPNDFVLLADDAESV